jgi:hypothetical protein
MLDNRDQALSIDAVDVVLEGGPGDLPDSERHRRATTQEEKVKVAHRGGYEHFERTSEVSSVFGEPRLVFRWTTRTRMAE